MVDIGSEAHHLRAMCRGVVRRPDCITPTRNRPYVSLIFGGGVIASRPRSRIASGYRTPISGELSAALAISPWHANDYRPEFTARALRFRNRNLYLGYP